MNMSLNHSKILKISVLSLFLVGFIFTLYQVNDRSFVPVLGEGMYMDFETARVNRILEDNTFIMDDMTQGNLRLELEILSGRYEGKLVETVYHFIRLANIHVQEGDRVSVRLSTMNGELASVAFDTFERRETLGIAVLLFFLVLVAVGGKKGLMSVAGLVFTLVSVVFLLIPLMLRGVPIIPVTIAVLGMVALVALFLLFGFSRKMWVSFAGCFLGVLIAATLSQFIGNILWINGLHMEQTDVLLRLVNIHEFGLQGEGLFVAGVMIAALGAVMDISVSIVSAMEEIKTNQPAIPWKILFKSGMNVGRDMMGTMTNTLILAFAGTGLNMIIVLYITSFSFNQLINSDVLAIEIIRAIAGSMGLILTIPIVALIQAKVLTK